jgi:hypothetical protein
LLFQKVFATTAGNQATIELSSNLETSICIPLLYGTFSGLA